MKILVTVILVVHLNIRANGQLMEAYQHYFGGGNSASYSGNSNLNAEQQQQQQQRDNSDGNPHWNSPGANWNDGRYREDTYRRSGGDKGCGATTIWIEKTEDSYVPVLKNNKESRDYPVKHEITKTIINTKSIPYFVTQTEVEPEITKKTAILKQKITHTVRTTNVKFITKTEKIYNTVVATRIQKIFKTVCPKGKGH